MSAPAGVLADLRGLVRIAKAASVGVSGNVLRIARAEAAIAAVAELVEDATLALELLESTELGDGFTAGLLRASIARVQGDASHA